MFGGTGGEATALGIVLMFAFFFCPLGIVVGIPSTVCFGITAAVLVLNGYYIGACFVAVLMVTPQDRWDALLEWITSGAGGLLGERRLRAGSCSGQTTRKAYSSFGSRDDTFGEVRDDTFKPVQETAEQSHERVLGLNSGFSRGDLDAARRRMAKLYHPDLHRDAPRKMQKSMAQQMRAVNDAYEALKGKKG